MDSKEKILKGLNLVVDGIFEIIEENKTNVVISDPKEEKQFKDTMLLKEAAEYLGISQYALRTATLSKEVKHLKIGNRYVYKKEALDEWVRENLEKSVE